MATLGRRLELTEETVESRRRTLRIVERRYRRGTGTATSVDVYLARENLAAAAGELPRLRSQLMEQAYALDLLLGQAPGTIDPLQADIPVLPPPAPVAAGVPAQLIDRRPDLEAAELRLVAAVAEIGVAVADLYPDLTLTGTIGFQNQELDDFFNSSNLFGSILGDVLLRLYEGGRLRATIDLQDARARELAAVYARQVLNALREVEVALGNTLYLSRQLELLEDRLENIRQAERGSRDNYRRGLISLLDVLEIERRRYVAEQAYLLVAQAAWNNRIALYLALGGDWLEQAPVLEPFPLPVKVDD